MATLANDTLVFASVSFSYRRHAVFRDFSWAVPEGKTVLLGPNGAGKTTLLSLGADVLRPAHGAVRLGDREAGRRQDRRAFRAAVGWMPQNIRSIPGFTCLEQVAYAGWLKGLSTGEAWRAASSALEQVGMAHLSERGTSHVSGGDLRRVGLAQMLVHRARVLLLDEPTVGLDPAQRVAFRETLTQLPAFTRVVVSTHQVDDLSELFGRVVVLDQGQIRFEGSVSAFLAHADPGSARPGESAYARVMSGPA